MSKIDDVAIALKHIRFAVEEAKKEGTPTLGILSTHPEGGGRIVCKFDCDFIEDVAALLGLEPLTDADRMSCSARQFLDRAGLR